MGGDPPHRPVPGRVPTQGRAMDHGEESPAAIGRELVISSDGYINIGIGVQRDGGVCYEAAEYGRAIHRDTTYSGLL